MITFDSPTKQASEDSADTSTLDRLRGLASPPKVSLSQQQFPSTQPFFASQAGLQWFSSQGSSQLQTDHGLCGGGGGGTSVLGALGVNTDDATVNMDPLFSANPYPRLPPIRTMPAPGASMHIRMCCYGFNVAKNVIMGGMTQEEVCDFVRSKVQTTQELLTGNPSSSVLLVDTPGHFFDEEKGLLWLVFKTKGTAVSRWESLGRSLESSQMNLISAHPLVKVGTRGFAHVVAHFRLSEKESNYLHCSTKIDIGFVKSEVCAPEPVSHGWHALTDPPRFQTKPRRSPTASASGGDGGMVKDEPQDRGGSGGLDDGQQQQQQKQDTKRGRYTEEDHDEEQASGEAAKHGKKKKKSKDAALTTPTTSMQARYKPVRSMTAGTPDELKTPKILQAVPAEDMGNDATLPVVRSLTGAFKDGPAGGDQPPSSPHRPKKVSRRTHDISSPPGNKGKSKAATGPSPNKRDHHQGKADDKSGPSIVPSTIVERCVHYISDAQSIETTLDFLAEFDGFARRAIGTASSANALEIIRNLSFEALNEFVILHSCLTKVLRERYCIPVENLTPTGIIPHHHNWTFLRDSDANGYAYLSEMLKNLIAGISDTFDKGVFLFDPVSISFFLGVQSLKLRLERQSRHNVFLQFACQDLAHVSPACMHHHHRRRRKITQSRMHRRTSSGCTLPSTASSCRSNISRWTTRRSRSTPRCPSTSSQPRNWRHTSRRS